MVRYRVFVCGACGKEVRICRRCDRGHQYCSPECSQAARDASCRKAQHNYQHTSDGRWNHAERQRRYRERKRKNVTHHSSGKPPSSSRMEAATAFEVCEREEATPQKPGAQDGGPSDTSHTVSLDSVLLTPATEDARCYFCGRPLGFATPWSPEWEDVNREDTQTPPDS